MKTLAQLLIVVMCLGFSQTVMGQQQQMQMVSVGAYPISNFELIVVGQNLEYRVVARLQSSLVVVQHTFPERGIGIGNVSLKGRPDVQPAYFFAEVRKAGDANGDGQVSFLDFLVMARSFGLSNVGYDGGDFDLDGVVGPQDMEILLANFGK